MTMHLVKFTGIQEVEMDIDAALPPGEKKVIALEETEGTFGLADIQILSVEEV